MGEGDTGEAESVHCGESDYDGQDHVKVQSSGDEDEQLGEGEGSQSKGGVDSVRDDGDSGQDADADVFPRLPWPLEVSEKSAWEKGAMSVVRMQRGDSLYGLWMLRKVLIHVSCAS